MQMRRRALPVDYLSASITEPSKFEEPFVDPHCNIYLSNLCPPFTEIFILFLKFYLVGQGIFTPHIESTAVLKVKTAG